jgi:hypothetical protein
MNSAVRIEFVLALMEGGWTGTRYQLIQVLDSHIEGMYDIILGDERKLTNDRAEFVLFVEPEEAEKAGAIVQYLTSQ